MFIDSYEYRHPKIKAAAGKDEVADLARFEDGEYCKGINVITAGNGKIGCLEFTCSRQEPEEKGKVKTIKLFGVQSK